MRARHREHAGIGALERHDGVVKSGRGPAVVAGVASV